MIFLFAYLFACLIAFLQRKFVSPKVSRVVGHLGTKQPSRGHLCSAVVLHRHYCVYIKDSVVVWAFMQGCGILPSKSMYDDILFDTSEQSCFVVQNSL